MTTYKYWTSCAGLDPDDHEQMEAHSLMRERGKEITFRTFQKLVGKEVLHQWADAHGYDRTSRGGGLTLSKDWHVAYYRSRWMCDGDDVECAYLVWSAFEEIFLAE